jgi:hydrogenase nickel incorporation protein HypA/HybF
MHELSISNAMLHQVALLVVQHGASGVSEITLRLGPLSGVEPELLRAAYLHSRAETVAAHADLVIVDVPIRILCQRCAAVGDARCRPLRLACEACGSDDTRLLGGDEMLLESVQLTFKESPCAPHAAA